MSQNAIEQMIQAQEWLDEVAEPIQQSIGQALKPGPVGTTLRNILHGSFLGHPLHPALTDVPIGAWAVAVVLDLLSLLPGGRRFESGADAAVVIGLGGAAGSAVTGLADWSHMRGYSRRLGLVHAMLNTTASLLYIGSLLMRLGGSRAAGRSFGLLGFGVVGFSAYLGGELVFRHGIGSAPAMKSSAAQSSLAEKRTPAEWADVGEEGDLKSGEMRVVETGGVPILLVRDAAGSLGAIAEECSHMGCSLAQGDLDGTTITCPCHDSKFDVHTGATLQGPASVPQQSYEVQVLAGRIKIRPAATE